MSDRALVVGDYVELSLKGLRKLKKSNPYGWVIATKPRFALKVTFEDGNAKAEWWPLDYFQLAENGQRLSGLSAPISEPREAA